MADYAMIESATIINICIWDGVTPFDPGTEIPLTPLADLPPGVSIGWTLSGGTWSAPPLPGDE